MRLFCQRACPSLLSQLSFKLQSSRHALTSRTCVAQGQHEALRIVSCPKSSHLIAQCHSVSFKPAPIYVNLSVVHSRNSILHSVSTAWWHWEVMRCRLVQATCMWTGHWIARNSLQGTPVAVRTNMPWEQQSDRSSRTPFGTDSWNCGAGPRLLWRLGAWRRTSHLEWTLTGTPLADIFLWHCDNKPQFRDRGDPKVIASTSL